MKTTFESLALPIAAAAALLVASHHASAQDGGAKQETAELDQAAMMEAYMKLLAPGDEHKMLATLVGEWETVQKLWMAPGAPPTENPGTASFKMLMGGRFLVQHYHSEIAGMGKFSGIGTTGFDNITKEFVNTWMDSFNTGIMTSRGKAEDEQTVVLIGESVEPFTNATVSFRTITNYIDKDNHRMEMYEKKEGSEERKIMEVTYKRIKPGSKSDSKEKQK